MRHIWIEDLVLAAGETHVMRSQLMVERGIVP
jgi:hypothetical protein